MAVSAAKLASAATLALLAAMAVSGAIGQARDREARAAVPRTLLGPSDTRASRVAQLAEEEPSGDGSALEVGAGAGADDAAALDRRGQDEAEQQGAEAPGSGGAPAADFPAEADTGKLQDAWWYKEYMDKTVPNTQTLRWSSAFAPGLRTACVARLR